jgi:hypothetical protein
MNLTCFLASIAIVALILVSSPGRGELSKDLNRIVSVENQAQVPVAARKPDDAANAARCSAEHPVTKDDATSVGASKAELHHREETDERFGFFMLFLHALRIQK